MTRDFLKKVCADKKEADIGCSKSEAEEELNAKLILCEYSEVIFLIEAVHHILLKGNSNAF